MKNQDEQIQSEKENTEQVEMEKRREKKEDKKVLNKANPSISELLS